MHHTHPILSGFVTNTVLPHDAELGGGLAEGETEPSSCLEFTLRHGFPKFGSASIPFFDWFCDKNSNHACCQKSDSNRNGSFKHLASFGNVCS